MRKFHVLLAVFYLFLLSNLCWSADVNNLNSIRERRDISKQLQNILDMNNITDGRILPTSKNDCVREIMGEIIFSKKMREGIDEKIKKGIEDAFDKNNGKKLLWVSLKVDIDSLSEDSQKSDPNKLNLEIYASPDFGRTKITPLVLANEKGTDWQGRYVKQELLYSLPNIRSPINSIPEKSPPFLFLLGENIELANFTFMGELATMIMERASKQNDIFPKIKPVRAGSALSIITSYAKKNDLKSLSENHMRYFSQPWGIVSRCVDVNLVSGEIVSYPGTHSTDKVLKETMSKKELAEIRDILTSKEFIRVPQQNNRVGADGHSDIIEVDIDGSYLWKMHWVTEDMNFINAMNKIGTILKPYKIDIGIPLPPQNTDLAGSPG